MLCGLHVRSVDFRETAVSTYGNGVYVYIQSESYDFCLNFEDEIPVTWGECDNPYSRCQEKGIFVIFVICGY